jgi:hypothetical protein
VFQLIRRLNRVAVVGAIAIGTAVAVSGFKVVRAELASPNNLNSSAVATVPMQQSLAAQRRFMVRYDSGAPKGYNHIICYDVTPTNSFPGATVALFDQFYPNGFKTNLSQTTTACTPAKKILLYRKPNRITPNGHFVCYAINDAPTIDMQRNYTNQLEMNSATFIKPASLCVPTDKLDGAPPPVHPNHLMMYSVKLQGASFVNPLPQTTVTLFDQFNTNGFTTTLGNPVAFLPPTHKELIKRKPIKVTPNGHWVKYSFTSPAAVSEARDYINQLEKNTVYVFFPSFLLVPTNKSM